MYSLLNLMSVTNCFCCGIRIIYHVQWKALFQLHLWNWFAGLCGHVLSSQPHVCSRCIIDLCCVCIGILSTTDCWSIWYLNTVFFIGGSWKYFDRSSCGMVCTLEQQVICNCS